jgi:hypothetical protein
VCLTAQMTLMLFLTVIVITMSKARSCSAAEEVAGSRQTRCRLFHVVLRIDAHHTRCMFIYRIVLEILCISALWFKQ